MLSLIQKIPAGYKQTEIGVIPEDWNVVRLSLLSNDIGDGIHSTPKYVDSSNYFFVNGNNLSDGRILITRDTKCISEDEYESLKKNLDNTTILMSINGTIGNLAFFNHETIVLGKSAAYIKLSQRIDKIFIYYLLQHSSIKKFYNNELTGTTIKNLSLASIRATPIPIPSTKPEQTAVATVLSNTDELIEHLEKLIAKKKAIKQGAMQQLLTGKKRLSGFSGEWEMKKLGKIGEIITGSTPPTQIKEYWNGLIPWITPTDISDKKDIYNSEREISPLGLQVIRKLPANTLLVTCIASIGKNAILRVNGACNQQINAIIPNEDADVDFLYYLIENNKQYLLGNAGITATLIISKKCFSEIVFSFPKNKSEQTTIATILSDMDAEIESLEQKRDKYIMLKQGMMQQLLTGRIRIYANN